jgi:hypothetical protein
MSKPSSSSKNVIAALVAAAFGLTAGTALAQTMSASSHSSTAASHRHASKKSARRLASAHRMKQTRSKEMRVASADRMQNGEHKQRSRMHSRNKEPANTRPPPQ